MFRASRRSAAARRARQIAGHGQLAAVERRVASRRGRPPSRAERGRSCVQASNDDLCFGDLHLGARRGRARPGSCGRADRLFVTVTFASMFGRSQAGTSCGRGCTAGSACHCAKCSSCETRSASGTSTRSSPPRSVTAVPGKRDCRPATSRDRREQRRLLQALAGTT